MNPPSVTANRPRPAMHHSGAWVVPISQSVLAIPSDDAATTFQTVRTSILEWIAQRAGRPLPPEAWHGSAFELEEVGAQRTAAVVLESPNYWAARADDADKKIPKRTWATEFGLAVASPTEVRFGCRLQCVSQGERLPVGRSIPWIVAHIARRFGGLVDGRRTGDGATTVRTSEDAADLVRLLVNRQRRRPVFAISERDAAGYSLLGSAEEAAQSLAARTVSLAHVFVISADAGFALTRALGREFSVFNGAVRTYRPAFDPDKDEPGDHPLAFLASIKSWPDGGPEAFFEFLAHQAFRMSVSGRDLEHELPAFTTLRQLSFERRRQSAVARGDSDSALLSLALAENDSLRRRIEDEKRTHEGLLEVAEDERDEALKNQDILRNDVRNLRERVNHLLAALEAKGRHEEVPIPVDFEDIEEWCRKHLAGSVVLINRAVRAARKSDFADPPLAYRALLVLRDAYVPMKNGQISREEYISKLAALGLEDSATFSGGGAGQFGDEYFVNHGGRRRELGRHLKGSNSRDERYGFRLYFFWDELTEQVVVGWLPTHLTTSIT